MESLAWIALAGTILVVVHLAILGYLYRQVRDDSVGGPFGLEPGADSEADDPPGDEQLVCPNCGTTNETHYRFCRSCVNDLRGGPRRSGGSTSSGRLRG